MISLFTRNLFFTLLQPGIVAGLVPYALAKDYFFNVFKHQLQPIQWVGLFVFSIGLFIMLHCIANFAVRGKGTLSPADPTKRLVISGLYHYSRNPMYAGVMLILIGEVIFTMSVSLLMYSAAIMTAFVVFVVFWEEPRLTKDFGDEYVAYTRRVRRWL